ncbi:glycosyltransferase [Anabaena subtropica]|uniref:Glycosyltransferase family 2 protein n=1 Tax=Anabaena subtropica FACHB-260 TaxID=2692884 RepID=A0ABR8CN75_9NOST|nr:glycosyltransferase family 2 protein [Anabaena subtropica]MBD2344686.1 glycosyltransferase family 2 protein [Anabaena subtropica FACHB-260]
MDELAILISKLLVIWLVVQVYSVLRFWWGLNTRSKNLPDEQLPKTAVVLCLRGVYPFLADCLRSLLQQNYPRYDLKLIVDSEQDPAWQVVNDIIKQINANNFQINHLRTVRQSCSLKCSSLLQAVSELDDSYKVIALVDADTIVHPNWLRELVSPLSHPTVGATTGNCWYVSTGTYWGTLVRYIGNVTAIVQMYLYGIPWGGTLAIKREVLHQTGLLEKWGEALREDTMIRRVLAKYNLRVQFVPSLIMLNQEECNLPSLRYWFQRQLLSSRLYHPHWWAVVGEAVLTIGLSQLLIVVWFIAFLSGQGDTATFALSWYVIYILALAMLMLFLELGVQPIIRSQGKPITQLSAPLILRMVIGIPLTHWIYGWAMIASLRMQTVNWRGVSYEVNESGNIRLVDYRPYQPLE